MVRWSRKLGVVAQCATLLLVTTAIAAAQAQDTKAPAQKTPVSLRLSWKMKGEYAPIYVALDKGYFAEEGLDVTPGEGAGSQAAIASVIQGQDQVTWLPGLYALQAASSGVAVKIVALYNPAAPNVIISLPEKPIRTPRDLEGKTLGNAVGDTAVTYLKVLCEKNNVDCAKIKIVSIAVQARVPALVGGKLDGVSVYRSNDVPILDEKFGKGHFVEMEVSKFGLNVVGAALAASDDYIAKNPKVLVGLIRALDRAMKFCKEDPDAAAAIMLKHWQTSLTPQVVSAQIRSFVDSAVVYPGKPVSWIDPEVIAGSLDTLKRAGEIKEAKAPEAYFTNAFAEAASVGW